MACEVLIWTGASKVFILSVFIKLSSKLKLRIKTVLNEPDLLRSVEFFLNYKHIKK